MNKRTPTKPNSNTSATNSTKAMDARSAALVVLGKVLDKRQALDEVLKLEVASDGVLSGLEARDRAFARLMVATTLRRRGQIDALLDQCLKRPLNEAKPRLQNILRLGVVQLIYLKTSPHAAVDATVRLAGREASSRGLINAVLRRLIREAEQLTPGDDTIHLNAPTWLLEDWVKTFGDDNAAAIVKAHLTEPPLDLTLKDPANSIELQSILSAEILFDGSLRRASGGRIEDLPGYQDGGWWVQDIAATLPARLLANSLGTMTDKHVVDLCAAPGGKTLQLCATGAEITAVDRSKKRLQLVAQNLQRTGMEAKLVTADAGVWQPEQSVDGVLLDAPCTATGTFRRHPDAAYLKSATDVTRMAELQTRLIDAAIKMIKPGGVLVYCTCSLQAAEGEDHAARLKSDDRLAHLPVKAAEIGGFSEAVSSKGDLRTLPSHKAAEGGMDGFFATRFRVLSH